MARWIYNISSLLQIPEFMGALCGFVVGVSLTAAAFALISLWW